MYQLYKEVYVPILRYLLDKVRKPMFLIQISIEEVSIE